MSSARVAVITGTSTGFGYETALQLSAAGFSVYGTMRDTAGRNAGPKAELEARGITIVEADVTDQASVDRAAATILAAAGHVDVLVNNAGTAHFGLTETFTPELFERQYATNVIGPHRVNRAFLPGMRGRRSGLIIFVSSVVGRIAIPALGVYTSSKWALEALAEVMSYELRPSGVDVAIVEPGAFPTNIFNAVVHADDPARSAAYGDGANIVTTLEAGFSTASGNPADVSAAIVALAEMPAGTRPLRTTVAGENPADAINAAIAPIQRGALEAYGFAALLPGVLAGV